MVNFFTSQLAKRFFTGIVWVAVCVGMMQCSWAFNVSLVMLILAMSEWQALSKLPVYLSSIIMCIAALLPVTPWLFLASPLFLLAFVKYRHYRLFQHSLSCYLCVVLLGWYQTLSIQALPTFITVCCVDTGAYLVGKYFGKHLLSAAISPKKTIEGCVGGMLGACIGVLFFPAMPWIMRIMLAGGMSVYAIVGDLLESAFKRCAAVKDSGCLLPGHGGLLDRIDGWIMVQPLVYGLYHAKWFLLLSVVK
jgi:CDP-diglyceride synthetase